MFGKKIKVAKKMGRPSVGDINLPALTVSNELHEKLKALAIEHGTTVPNVRREAYKRMRFHN